MLDRMLHVAQTTGRGDPAFDRAHPDYLTALRAYARSRLPSDLAAIPLREGRSPRLFAVRVLSPEARAIVRDAQGDGSRALLAVRMGVASYADGPTTHSAPTESSSHLGAMASRDWCVTLSALGGGMLLDELAAVVIHRADYGDADEGAGGDVLAPFDLPPGARLAL
jgi:hypothetical protein